MFLQSILQLHHKRVEGQKKFIYKSLVVGKNAGGTGGVNRLLFVCTVVPLVLHGLRSKGWVMQYGRLCILGSLHIYKLLGK